MFTKGGQQIYNEKDVMKERKSKNRKREGRQTECGWGRSSGVCFCCEEVGGRLGEENYLSSIV